METLNAIVNILILISVPVFGIMAVHSYGRAKYWEGMNNGFDEACKMHNALDRLRETVEEAKRATIKKAEKEIQDKKTKE
jgi:hypothetical protein